MLKVFESFRGYGSQTLALKKYNIDHVVVGGCEIDKYADIAHEALHGSIKNYGDITKINALALPDFDLFTYSFPCQDISMAGKQRGFVEGSGTRSSLLWECQKIIELKRPKYLMMENVKNLVGKKNKPHFEDWLQVLNRSGYNNYWKVINAKWCGVPQNRERVFCVSILKSADDGKFKFYDDFDSGIRLKDILKDQVDEKYYLSEKALQGLDRRQLNSKKRGSGFGYNLEDGNGISKTILKRYGKDGKECLIIEACRITGRNPENPKSRVSGMPTVQMLEVNKNPGISNCLTTVQEDTMILEKPSFKIRKLTPRECFRLMGVLDTDIDKIQASGISNSQQYKMAGNSIVVDCMKFLDQLK